MLRDLADFRRSTGSTSDRIQAARRILQHCMDSNMELPPSAYGNYLQCVMVLPSREQERQEKGPGSGCAHCNTTLRLCLAPTPCSARCQLRQPTTLPVYKLWNFIEASDQRLNTVRTARSPLPLSSPLRARSFAWPFLVRLGSLCRCLCHRG